FFVLDPGGTGKSQLFKCIMSAVRSQGDIALPVSSSGIEPLLLPGGTTAHALFKMPV
ncbi:hypothetical protein BC940DRAFT_223840, partial [Gongronella butleri]